MHTTTTPSDYDRGFRDGIAHMQQLEDEAAILDVIFSSKTRDDLSRRQIKLLDKCVSACNAAL